MLSAKYPLYSFVDASAITSNKEYSYILLYRDTRLALDLEEILMDVILADPSDYGVDLAVGKIFIGYQPGPHRWEQLWHLNSCWLTCRTEATAEWASQRVGLGLLHGTLQVNDQPLGSFPLEFRDSLLYQEIFRDVCTCFCP